MYIVTSLWTKIPFKPTLLHLEVANEPLLWEKQTTFLAHQYTLNSEAEISLSVESFSLYRLPPRSLANVPSLPLMRMNLGSSERDASRRNESPPTGLRALANVPSSLNDNPPST
jgi:hypothetical protein